MTSQPSFYEDSVFDLLIEEDPEHLEARRILALKMIRRISPQRLRQLLSPTLACALLDAMRLGGLEMEAESYAADEYTELLAIRRLISEVAHAGGQRYGVASVYARGDRWEPIFLAVAPCPGPMSGPGTVVIDDARHRVDGPATRLREVLAAVDGGQRELRIARTRFDAAARTLPDSAALAAATALVTARRRPARTIPRFATIGAADPQADLGTLPPDVRVVFIERGARLPRGAESWAEIDGIPGPRTLSWLREGGHACFHVDSPAEAAAALCRLHEDRDVQDAPSGRAAGGTRAVPNVPMTALWGAMVAAAAEPTHG
ncbi:MAG: hypothetical protein H6744_10245 [Deltaproteobacteria bacterium]|nr:hypothetical protein [Deltaproteobacteria bacterium]